jgi:hypothetical protein
MYCTIQYTVFVVEPFIMVLQRAVNLCALCGWDGGGDVKANTMPKLYLGFLAGKH